MSLNSNNMSDDKDFLADWQIFLANVHQDLQNISVQHYINAKNLACPMPLLKLKMALKQTDIGNWVYLTAADPNSQNDIGAFCYHANLSLIALRTEQNGEIFHLLVEKKA